MQLKKVIVLQNFTNAYDLIYLYNLFTITVVKIETFLLETKKDTFKRRFDVFDTVRIRGRIFLAIDFLRNVWNIRKNDGENKQKNTNYFCHRDFLC